VNEELEVLAIVAERLETASIPYMLSGSMAMNFYAQPRMTRDLDLVIELSLQDAARIVELFEPEFSCDLDEIREAITRQRIFNLIHIEKVVKVDFVVRKSNPFRLQEFRRRRRVLLDKTALWIVSPEDLVLSKLFWAKDTYSELQLRDVRNIIASINDLDWPYVEGWAAELGIEALVEQVKT
jgi:hypothetical protein